MTAADFEGEALERLKAAAEDMAFLGTRGYEPAAVEAMVAAHRQLTAEQRAVLARVAYTGPQYKRRAVTEMLPEDIARRPLLIDGDDVLDTVTTALAGGLLLEAIDQTLQPVTPGGSPAQLDAALEKIGPVLREMRPSRTKWFVSDQSVGDKLLVASKKWKVAVEVAVAADYKATLKKSANVATSDPAVIDVCKSWCNLAGPIVATIPTAKRLKLQ